jgi:hypothetical protein
MSTNSIGVQHNEVVGRKNNASVASQILFRLGANFDANAGHGNRLVPLQTSEERRQSVRPLFLAA